MGGLTFAFFFLFCALYVIDLLIGLPSEKLSIGSVDQQNNSALHLACLKVWLNIIDATS